MDVPLARVFVTGQQSLVALGSATGMTAFRVHGLFAGPDIGQGTFFALDLATQHLFVVSAVVKKSSVAFTVLTLDARTGAVVRRTPLNTNEMVQDLVLGLVLLDAHTGTVLHTSPLEDSGPMAFDLASLR